MCDRSVSVLKHTVMDVHRFFCVEIVLCFCLFFKSTFLLMILYLLKLNLFNCSRISMVVVYHFCEVFYKPISLSLLFFLSGTGGQQDGMATVHIGVGV